MELLIAILMYLGVVTPQATATMSDAEMNNLINSNQQLIEQSLSDPWLVEAAASSDFAIDRRED